MDACASSVALLLILGTIPNPWEEIDDDDGIKVWARDVPGSDVREVQAETVVKASPARIWAVLGDIDAYPEFMPYVVETRIIGRHPKGHYEYQRIDPPLVDERDYVLKITYEKDDAKGIWKRAWAPAKGRGPKPTAGVVRVTINEGVWTIVKLEPAKCVVSYYLYTHPGGSIPDWIANKANSTSVPDLLNAVRQRAINPAWKRE